VTQRTQVRRLPQRAAYDTATLHAILDEGIVAHVAFQHEGQPAVVPTGYVRDGDRVLLHGSAASRMMRALASQPVCVAVTLLDGLVLARSAFNHSMNYRSAVVYGQARQLEGDAKLEALRVYMDRLVPGRWDAARQPNAKEVAATLVVELSLKESSCKVRTGPPVDDAEDLTFPCWAGVVPLRLRAGPPAQAAGQAPMPVPPAVEAWRPERRKA
jgi:nitroimidazol reductase NimA-like FMN-containing flavoprotein (pyridoxamine 5'-phosphate oxidase superfamily)